MPSDMFNFCNTYPSLSYITLFYMIGDYIACTYDHDIGIIESVCADEGDLSIKFMHLKGSGWRYPKNIF